MWLAAHLKQEVKCIYIAKPEVDYIIIIGEVEQTLYMYYTLYKNRGIDNFWEVESLS